MIIQQDIERFDYPLSLIKSQHFLRVYNTMYNVIVRTIHAHSTFEDILFIKVIYTQNAYVYV